MIKCDQRAKAKCPFRKTCCDDEVAWFLEGSECDKFNQKVLSQRPTNADRIRAMSDDELAARLAMLLINSFCRTAKNAGIRFEFDGDQMPHTTQALLEWLQQPAEGE